MVRKIRMRRVLPRLGVEEERWLLESYRPDSTSPLPVRRLRVEAEATIITWCLNARVDVDVEKERQLQ